MSLSRLHSITFRLVLYHINDQVETLYHNSQLTCMDDEYRTTMMDKQDDCHKVVVSYNSTSDMIVISDNSPNIPYVGLCEIGTTYGVLLQYCFASDSINNKWKKLDLTRLDSLLYSSIKWVDESIENTSKITSTSTSISISTNIESAIEPESKEKLSESIGNVLSDDKFVSSCRQGTIATSAGIHMQVQQNELSQLYLKTISFPVPAEL